MRNPYSQLAVIYFSRPFRSLSMSTFVFSGLLTLIVTLLGRPHLERVISQLAGSMIFLNMVVWLIFYEQVANPRLRLFPGFVRPQLLIFTLFAGTLLGVDVLALCRCPDASITGCIGLIVGLFALMGMAILIQSILFFSTLLGIFFWVLYGAGFTVIQHIFNGTRADIAMVMAVGSFVLLAVVLWRFFNLHEESTAFRTSLGFDGGTLKLTVTGEQNRAWARTKETGPMALLRDSLSPTMIFDHSRWWAVRRWRYLHNTRLLPILAAAMAVPTMYISYQMRSVANAQFETYPAIILFMLLFTTPAGWLQRWRYIEAESLRPVDRDVFFKQLGWAMAIDFAFSFTAGLVATLLPMFLGVHSRIFSFSFLVILIFALAAFVLMFGYSAWVIRFRSQGTFVLSILFLTPIAGLPVWVGGPMSLARYQSWLLAAAFVIAIIGIALARRGYRLWLNTELG